MSAYETLADEDKVLAAIEFVAQGQPLPDVLVNFLKAEGLYNLIVLEEQA